MVIDDIGFDELPASTLELKFDILQKYLKDVVGIETFDLDILRTLGLYKNDTYNRAGELLADENDIKSSYVDMVRFGETESVFLERKRVMNTSLLTQYDEAMDFFDRWYHTYEEVIDGKRQERTYIPRNAFREALANAIIHRDFMINSFVRIAMYEDRIEITSPGDLPKGVTKEQYLHGAVSVPRNQIIAEVFNRLGIIEKFATGIKRIRKEYELFLSAPEFRVDNGFIRVVLPRAQYDNGKEVSNSLNSNKKAEIFKIISLGGELKRSEIEHQIDLSRSRLTDLLQELINEGRIERIGKSVSTRYRSV